MNKEQDLFSDVIKEKLENYCYPVDVDSWDIIEQNLNSVNRRSSQQRWIAVVAIAASIALLLYFVIPINKKTQSHGTADQLSENEETIIQNVSKEEIIQSFFMQNVEYSPVSKKSKSIKRQAENSIATAVILKEEISKEETVISSKEEQTSKEYNLISSTPGLNFGDEERAPISSKPKKQRSVNFSFSSGRILLAQNSSDAMQKPNRSPLIPSDPDLEYFKSAAFEVSRPGIKDIINDESFSEIVYQLPLSFGVTIKKELSRTFAIESGIVYSFISTSFSKEYLRTSAKLQLHYIGIPLNIHTRLIGNQYSKWGVYFAAGGMVEKGLLAHYQQKIYYDNIDNYTKTVISDEKIDGFQWSVGISPGIDYKVLKNYSIYFEPKLSYYFDNNQPISARTNHPLVIGINAGVRYLW